MCEIDYILKLIGGINTMLIMNFGRRTANLVSRSCLSTEVVLLVVIGKRVWHIVGLTFYAVRLY